MAVNLLPGTELPYIDGIDIAVAESAMRYQGRPDLLVCKLADNAVVSALFTKNQFVAAPVILSKQHLCQAKPRALLVNSGNANAGTGALGLENARRSCQHLADLLGIDQQSVLPFSTGVIGEQLDMPVMLTAIEKTTEQLNTQKSASWLQAASAIMTTDTVAKTASRTLRINNQTITINGIAKGSGMICPDMATMLAFIATDAAIDVSIHKALLQQACEQSFNCITVDSDTSTNDALVLISTGRDEANRITSLHSEEAKQFSAALLQVCQQLATAIVRDGEGASKFVTIEVNSGSSNGLCRAVAYAIAHSPLVKTTLFASDPNWGRLLMAIGKVQDPALKVNAIDLSVNGVALIAAGEPAPGYNEELGQLAFSADEIEINVALNSGVCQAIIWTTDLSHDYVRINADYRS